MKGLAILSLAFGLGVAGCATTLPPTIQYDAEVPLLDAPPPIIEEPLQTSLHRPPPWRPSYGGPVGKTAAEQVANANAAARVRPIGQGYYNAIQFYPWDAGALYQVYAAVGKVTDIMLEPGEQLAGSGPIAAGDTARWVIGTTTSGADGETQVHILVKPTRPDISTNLVITSDRRSYLIELEASDSIYMPAIAWDYPRTKRTTVAPVPTVPVIPAEADRRYRYALGKEAPPWRPIAVYDDGRRVYIEFPKGIVQGEMPPLFVIGVDGKPQIANSRVHGNILIVDQLFAAAELRLGSGPVQETLRITRSDGRPAS